MVAYLWFWARPILEPITYPFILSQAAIPDASALSLSSVLFDFIHLGHNHNKMERDPKLASKRHNKSVFFFFFSLSCLCSGPKKEGNKVTSAVTVSGGC